MTYLDDLFKTKPETKDLFFDNFLIRFPIRTHVTIVELMQKEVPVVHEYRFNENCFVLHFADGTTIISNKHKRHGDSLMPILNSLNYPAKTGAKEDISFWQSFVSFQKESMVANG